MTEDYKMYAKDWIANTYTYGSTSDYNLFYGKFYEWTQVYEDFDTDAIVKCTKQVVSPNNTGVMWTIVALYSDTLNRGRLAILNEELQLVTTIDQYTSGANVGCYYDLELDEKGRLYGIEWFNEERVRFIMLNNIAIPKGTTYYADIRKAYDVPTLNGHAPLQKKEAKATIIKCLNASKYGIAIYEDTNNCNVYTFEISVNDGNTWKEKFISSVFWEIKRPRISYDSDNKFTFKILQLEAGVDPTFKYATAVEGDSDISLTENVVYTNTNGKEILSGIDIWWIDNSKILVPFSDSTYEHLVLQTLDVENETTYTQVYSEDFYSQHLIVKFNYVNGCVFMYVLGVNDLDAPQTYGWKECIYHLFHPGFEYSPVETNFYEEVLNDYIGEAEYTTNDICIVQNQYNLFNHIIGRKTSSDDGTGIFFEIDQEIYNENNYNGSPYIPLLTTALNPQQFILKNGNKILYARNVYNKIANENEINISLLIPNNLVNDIEINKELLWSSTKFEMNNENKVITKNKYEELIFNIQNTLNVYDNNDNQMELLKSLSSTLHKAMNRIVNIPVVGLSIQQAKINYSDDTSEIINTSSVKNNDVSTISLDITPSKQISSIEFQSRNNTTFLTITPTLKIGKTYKISQDVRIGG